MGKTTEPKVYWNKMVTPSSFHNQLVPVFLKILILFFVCK